GGRQIASTNPFATAKDDGVLDGGAELPNIPRPGIIDDEIERIRGEAFYRFVIFDREFLQKDVGEFRNVFFPFPQRREPNPDDIQATVKVLAKRFFLDL